MNIKFVFSTLILTSFLVGCNSMKVTSEADQEYDFSQVKTYQWVDGPADILDDADIYINEDIQKALDFQLNKQGLQSVTSLAEANIQIAYYVKLKEETEYTETTDRERDFSGGFVYNRDTSSWSYDEREPDLNVYTVEIGTLTVLVYEAKTGKRIWRGNLKTKIERSQPKERQEERIHTAAQKLLSHFPGTGK